MGYGIPLKSALIVGSILGLLLVGLIIALRSGVGSLQTTQDRERLAGNFSQLLLRLVGYLAGLAALQRLLGIPLHLGW
jgi:hypothetical protein